MSKDGQVVWITGLSATGKSTVAKHMKAILDDKSIPTVIVDGDEVREMVADDCCGHDRESRIKNAYRICRLTRMIARQGFTVLVATMSLYHEVHAWNRLNLPGYMEVLLEADLDVLKSRDPKGLYEKLSNGQEKNMGGVDIEAEYPQAPDLHIKNNGGPDNIPVVAEQILKKLLA